MQLTYIRIPIMRDIIYQTMFSQHNLQILNIHLYRHMIIHQIHIYNTMIHHTLDNSMYLHPIVLTSRNIMKCHPY